MYYCYAQNLFILDIRNKLNFVVNAKAMQFYRMEYTWQTLNFIKPNPFLVEYDCLLFLSRWWCFHISCVYVCVVCVNSIYSFSTDHNMYIVHCKHIISYRYRAVFCWIINGSNIFWFMNNFEVSIVRYWCWCCCYIHDFDYMHIK